MADGTVTVPIIAVDAALLTPAITGVVDADADTISQPSGQTPLTVGISTVWGASATTSNKIHAIAEVPIDGSVESVSYTPNDAITGADTDTRTLILDNRGQDGNSTTAIAQLTFGSGVDADAHDELELTLTSALANREVDAGEILAFSSTHSGGGIADPGGLIQIKIGRR